MESLEVVSVVLPDRNFSVKVRVGPVSITAKTVTERKVNAMFIPAIFFGLPEVRDAFEFGKFTLNQIAIKFRFGLSATGTAMSVVKATLKQKPVERFIHEELASRFAIVKRF